MSTDSPLRNRVKELRSRLGLRQTDLADEIGVTRQTIIAIEKGRLNPSH
jgi:putative transcriptional regulator